MNLTCPLCGGTYDTLAALNDDDARRFFGLIADMPPEVIHPLIRYLRLFKPTKTRLRWTRMNSITKELLPMIQSGRFKRDHQTWPASEAIWSEAMMSLVDSPPASLRLPLKSNGYLFTIMATLCEKHAAQAENQHIKETRQRAVSKPNQSNELKRTVISEELLNKQHEARLNRYKKAQEAKHGS